MTNEATQRGPQSGPLCGVRVLDVSRYIAGPYAGQLLGYLGAEVIKVEEPGGGDPMRHLSKHSVDGMAAHFIAGNASKKSITIDLRADAGRALFLDLARRVDVVLENFRPGVMEKMGLGPEALRAANPRLIVASVTGFGQDGPWRDWAAYDLIAQAVGGGMSLTGWPGEKPVKMGVPIGDIGAGVFAALAITAALLRRAENGEGEHIDVSMMDVQLSLLNYHAHYYWLSGQSPEPEGDAHPNITPYQSFDTKTRPLVVAVYGDKFWKGFCEALERPDLVAHPLFATNARRMQNKPALVAALEQHLLTQERGYWVERLVDHGVPVGPLNNVGEALESEQAVARGMTHEAALPSGEMVKLIGSPMRFARWRTKPGAPPVLGQHTDAVLRDILGLDAGAIAALRAAGTV